MELFLEAFLERFLEPFLEAFLDERFLAPPDIEPFLERFLELFFELFLERFLAPPDIDVFLDPFFERFLDPAFLERLLAPPTTGSPLLSDLTIVLGSISGVSIDESTTTGASSSALIFLLDLRFLAPPAMDSTGSSIGFGFLPK